MHTLRQFLFTLADPEGLTRRLGKIVLCRDAAGMPEYAVENSAIVFRVRHEGRLHALRCFLRPMRHLREIHGERLLERELYLYNTPATGEWVNVVLDEWIEGENLREAIHRAMNLLFRHESLYLHIAICKYNQKKHVQAKHLPHSLNAFFIAIGSGYEICVLPHNTLKKHLYGACGHRAITETQKNRHIPWNTSKY